MAESFWARKIREQMPQARPPETAPLPPTQGPWWHQETVQRPPSDSPTNYPVVQSRPEQEAAARPGEIIIDRRKFQSQRDDPGTCPDCGSSNYFQVMATKYLRCYDCGWPIRHTTSGVVATSDGSPAQKARQINPSGIYQPQTIIGRLQ